jgi:NAD(P)-dependent dehydrogenase (short-subunit alcohol dehydrogenase family)
VTAPVALVTGAAGDIGRAVAVALGHDGWSLLLTDHPEAEAGLAESAAACEPNGATVVIRSADLLEPDGVERLTSWCVEQLGTPTGIVNSAGLQGAFEPIHRYPVEDARRVLSLNVVTVMEVMGRCARTMIDERLAGSIVNLASMAGVTGAPNMPAYAASKAAVIGLTRSAAKDLAPFGIRVNAVSPGFIGPGRMWENQVQQQSRTASQYYPADPAQVARSMVAMVPMRRLGSPDEVAAAVGYLLGDGSSYVTGVNLEVTGGQP